MLAYEYYMMVYFPDISNNNVETDLRPAYAQCLIEGRKLGISPLYVSFAIWTMHEIPAQLQTHQSLK